VSKSKYWEESDGELRSSEEEEQSVEEGGQPCEGEE